MPNKQTKQNKTKTNKQKDKQTKQNKTKTRSYHGLFTNLENTF